MTKKVIIMKGLPGSGKSTWAKELVDRYPGRYKRISKDELRAMFDNSKWSQGNEKFVLKVRDALILLALQEGYHVIVDDTNLLNKHEMTIRELVKGQATVEIQDFTSVDIEICIERDRRRPNYVGEQVIRKMYRDFLQPKPAIIIEDPALPAAIICDIDGTLARISGRNPYDASLCEQDALNTPVADIVNMTHMQQIIILLVSGRKESSREPTLRWLKKYDVPFSNLWMRAEGDERKDVLVKRDIYEQQIMGKYNIKFVLDDRNQVVDLWRSLGLTCLQVDEGDF